MAANRQAKQKAILSALRVGNTRRAAAAAAGAHFATFYEWLKDPTFFDAVTCAEAEAELEMMSVIRTAALQGDARSAQWWAEHHPSSKQDWKRVNEIQWRDIPTETLCALLGEGDGSEGVDSPGDRLATAGDAAE